MPGAAEQVGIDRSSWRARRSRRRPGQAGWIASLLLGPAALMLLVLVCYPIAYTIWLSLHNADGSRFVGLDNYATMLSAPETRRAIGNTIIWVVVAPSVVTAVGLIVAVLTERVRRASALKLIMFMPMAISFLSAGVTFRLVYDESPDRGALNAAIVTVHDVFAPPSQYYGARPRPEAGLGPAGDGGFETAVTVPADPVRIPLVGLPADRVPDSARPARLPDGPEPAPDGQAAELAGVVWLDITRGGGGSAGSPDPTEPGLPGITVQVWRDTTVVATTTTDETGRFAFAGLPQGRYLIVVTGSNFTEPFGGLTWLGPTLITPAVIGAYIWIWAGFAMLLISAGLTALPREAVEAARVDGATEWQILRRVTIPLIRPVLVVVLVTLT
ncbi:MAG TPA: sugar ABC transporter permease, partial [Micromonosporaceae bacterium]